MSVADSEAPIVFLSATKHFAQLPTRDAQFYAHHLSRAAHWGTRAVLRSVLPELENIYDMILEIHHALGAPRSEDQYAQKLGVAPAVALGYLEYASQFLGNLGNYKSFGDSKFVPRIAEDDFAAVVRASASARAQELFALARSGIFGTDRPLLGWPEKGHVSSYYPGGNVTQKEIEAVNSALAARGIMPENTRVTKEDGHLVVLVASASDSAAPSRVTVDGKPLVFRFGDHKHEFRYVVDHIKEAAKYAANDTQRVMLAHYADSFESGSMVAHKALQVAWVKDLGPAVESNIGFIETYRDPSGVRGEWEGLVAMVNRDRTAKFGDLVRNAHRLIVHLPWDKLYEKDTFTPPDFTSLEVLTFAGSGVPAGINIPNYDDVRLNIGFKNVSLGNVLSANPKKPKKEEVISFIDDDLLALFRQWRDDAFEVQVGLHELLGHGTGKLLLETRKGVFNFDRAQSPVSYYKPGETWGLLFGTTAGLFEECRAELVALYLILKRPADVLPIFGIAAKDFDDVMLVATVLMVRAGLLGLEFWDPALAKWGQPHMQARFGIFKALHAAGVVALQHGETFDDLKLVVDQSTLQGAAVEALGDFLLKLHVYKATANVKEGVAYYTDMTRVTPDYAKFRDVVMEKKLPRKQLIQANTLITGPEIEVREYEESEIGMIQSFYERKV